MGRRREREHRNGYFRSEQLILLTYFVFSRDMCLVLSACYLPQNKQKKEATLFLSQGRHWSVFIRRRER